MSKATERIWIDRSGNVYDRDVTAEIGATEYIRADLAEREALRADKPSPTERVVKPDLVDRPRTQAGAEPVKSEAAIEIKRLRAEVEQLSADKAELIAVLAESQESVGDDWRERRDAILARYVPDVK